MPDSGLTPAQRRLGIAAATACVSVVGVGLSLGFPLLSFMLEARGASGRVIGLVTAMAGIATILVSPFAPLLVRRLGATVTLLLAILLSALSFLAFYWAEPLWLWFVLRFLNGAGLAILFVVSEFWVNALAPPERRGLVMGIYATVLSLGFAVGPAILAAIGPHGLLPFAIGTGLALLAGVPALLGAGVAPQVDAPPRRSVAGFLLAAPSATLAALVFGAVETGGMSLLPVYGLRVGLDETTSALLVTAVALGNVALQVPIGHLSDRTDRRKVLLACALVGLAGAALMPLAAGRTVLLLGLLFVWGGTVAALYTVGLTQLGARFTGAELASANAAFVMLYSAGMLAGPPLVGAGLDLWNPHGFAAMLALFLALYVCVVAVRSLPFGVGRRPLVP